MGKRTKKEAAIELYERVKRGPAGVVPSEHYDLWFRTWVAQELKNLIPQLKNVKR